MTPREIVRSVLWLMAILAAVFLIMTVRFHWEAKRCLREGLAALEQIASDPAAAQTTATDWFDRAIRAHSLLDGPGEKAAQHLRELAEAAEAAGDLKRATDVYQTLLSALAAVDTGLSPARRKVIRELEETVAELRRLQLNKNEQGNEGK